MMKTCPIGILEFHFQQLGILVSIVKQHIRNYLEDIFSLIQEYWNPTANIQLTIISLVEAIAMALDNEFKIYLPVLLPQLLQILETDQSEKRMPAQKVLHALTVFGGIVDDYLHLVIPVIVRLFEKQDSPVIVRKAAIQCVGILSRKVNFSDHASRIVHPLVRILHQPITELRVAAMDTLTSLIYRLSTDFVVFVPMIHKVMTKQRITHRNYEMLVSKLLKNEHLPQELDTNKDEK
jgi:FKBP12-rapamycin complex-associated protein